MLLETDHRRFEALLKQGEETTERGVKTRTDLLETLTAELNVHELIEEQILYPRSSRTPRPARSCSRDTRSTTWRI